jgi:AraC-like DNA-binding protein
MKPILIKTTAYPNRSFTIEEHVGAFFNYPYHFHPEYELTLILKGKGTRLVGNSINSFDNSDLILLGKNVPHHWHSDAEFHQPGSELSVRGIVLKFDADFNGVRLFELPEYYEINQLLQRAAKGIKVFGKTFSRISEMMELLLEAQGPQSIALLINILVEITHSKEIEYLSNTDYTHHISVNEMDRMNAVYKYIINNYTGHITLTEAAGVANMHESSFCKYFKKRYDKTFIEVVNEVRISHACRQILNEDITVAEVCYQSGFNNLSNFTKIFKKITGHSPKEYQKVMLNKANLNKSEKVINHPASRVVA